MNQPELFPPSPALRGRSRELSTLARTVRSAAPARIALVGSGGSGKSMLACALGHRLSRDFGGRLSWFRIGAWDFYTLTEMLALRFGVERGRERVKALRRFLCAGEPRLIVLDNHEDDRATARLLEALAPAPVTFVLTARRCLLSGVLIYPVVAPLVSSGGNAFPRVARLTRLLRWNPLALDIADALVGSGAVSAPALERHLRERGVDRVRPTRHEDDVQEVALLVAWAWRRLAPEARRMLMVLSHSEGDHIDAESLAALARAGKASGRALAQLVSWRLVQEPFAGRYTVHAVVRHAVAPRGRCSPDRYFEHYVRLLTQRPERLLLEQSHLFAAMDHAHRASDLSAMLRVEALTRELDARAASASTSSSSVSR